MRRAIRRHHDNRIRRKRLITHRWAKGNARLLGIYVKTPCGCSCIGCRNRRADEGPTLQERRTADLLHLLEGSRS